MEFLRSFLRRHLAGKSVEASPNVGCFLRLVKLLSIHLTVIFLVKDCVHVSFTVKNLHFSKCWFSRTKDGFDLSYYMADKL